MLFTNPLKHLMRDGAREVVVKKAKFVVLIHSSCPPAGSSGSHHRSACAQNCFVAIIHLHEYNFQLWNRSRNSLNCVQYMESTPEVSNEKFFSSLEIVWFVHSFHYSNLITNTKANISLWKAEIIQIFAHVVD